MLMSYFFMILILQIEANKGKSGKGPFILRKIRVSTAGFPSFLLK